MTDETAAGGNATENIMKENSNVNVLHRYRTKISAQTLQFARLEHIKRRKSVCMSFSSYYIIQKLLTIESLEIM